MKTVSAVLLTLLLSATALTASAQKPSKAMSDDDRQRFRAEMRAYKHNFLARELDLTRNQQQDFFPVYDEMNDEIDRIGAETRALEREVSSKEDASDVELEAAARAVFSQKSTEGDVENQYFDRFKQILEPRQLLQLRAAERKFTKQLMRHHRRARSARQKER